MAPAPSEEQAARHVPHAPQVTFPVVGIGASAGGIRALIRFFAQMPADAGMAFVIVLHLAPDHESNAAAVFQSATRMPVRQVTETMRIEPNHVYVIAPHCDLSMQDDTLVIRDAVHPHGRQVAIDLFLRGLAEAHQQRAVGIILSGTGSDGAVGIARIKECGGISMAQSPDDAEYDSMPRSAIETGMVDIVLPVTDMPQRLIALTSNATALAITDPEQAGAPEAGSAPPMPGQQPATEDALRRIMAILRERTSHDFTHYKRATVLRRIERRLHVHGLRDLAAYGDYLLAHPQETRLLLDDMLIGVTNFFRDHEAFAALERDIIPRLLAKGAESGELRAWSVACATGEETYSLAMLLSEYGATMVHPPKLQIFGSDIDEHAIAVARQGLYPASIEADVTPGRLREFFSREQNHYRVSKSLRERILFAPHNILRDPPFSRLDLIVCRNLLIYLDRDIQQKVFEMFHFALHPGGYLFLGSAESADAAAQYFHPVDKKNRIFQATPVSRTGRYVPPLPFGSSEAVRFIKPGASHKASRSFADLHRNAIEQCAPPSVIVDDSAEILHSSGEVARFLHFAAGAPSHNLLVCVQPELRQKLHVALFQANRAGARTETRAVRLQQGGRELIVKATVHPLRDENAAITLLLVMFHEKNAGEELAQAGGHDPVPLLVTELENELVLTRRQLQDTIEQYETSAEELKASNEELQAINEELRSATEELETSKEELQSINEELITVNCELKTKVDETSMINDDLRNFIASTEIATVFVDRGMRIKRYTPQAAQLFNLIATDIGRPLLDITHRLDYPQMIPDAQDAFDRLQVVEREVTSDIGRCYLARTLPYRTAEDRIDGLVLSFIDITTRRRAEAELRAGEERMRLIAASTRGYAILTLDLNGIVTSWNMGAARLFGFEESDVLGRSVGMIYTAEDRALGLPELEMQTAREQGSAEDERWHLRKDGSRIFCSGIMSPLVDPVLCGYVKIARDVTGTPTREDVQKSGLESETLGRAAADEAARLQKEAFAQLSHALKQPLNLIHMNVSLLRRLPETRDLPAVENIADAVSRSILSQTRIIDLLRTDGLPDVSRISVGIEPLDLIMVDWRLVIRRTTELMAPEARARDITLALETDSNPVYVVADAVRLEQIGWNLVTNALKCTPDGGRIEVSLKSEGDCALLCVRDSGKGIAPEFLPHVFDKFRPDELGAPRRQGGPGIGLALIRYLAESHGGMVSADSMGVGHGAEFRVTLPRAPAPDSASPAIDGAGSA